MFRPLHPDRLRLRCWDGECVVYNDITGDTHLLVEPYCRCLRCLLERGSLTGEEPDLADLPVRELLEQLARLRLCHEVA